ncbi:MAG: hypothetical protein A2725_03015 [Candidatus Magasanikbacteria bacterium RIFCSPHIGHO2_01_FULL_33_34]|uniref:Rhodanese domain-containing protein n=1 Tax=Candidatus Magasanikbacteria bacterium RIFCSPHIGHO2_01_FULL_33_34 TaxID=1798671 RepID=A0A1F6LH79_9BACT|nr:MAG: hypothetical protein A2725_03015 [Candidatus Magasanikbacteria bacterium RIFCSPHIGHO2_01_FULL_33_34]OGH66103.1 MAG: hypothetical protein A3B83_00505 [Candidatus Magasanikbacteria bacterium RIFCSPHIGHO2_02_FULL_33_17]OGH75949.1 MAG: hypothetical protein A3A89_00415 [Candidatus Magasanikbacteria bacterium RIFCSPLOWO2_01_FULL_33_34]OGH80947.1 MAG: hypothetical protein A3F93_02425 [Candidatus Magasanikbacteria bacterium RIFCSPLOWO2_12_FULL_34_7]
MYHVFLYYKIVKIKNPSKVVNIHKEICRALQLRGRILIGKDGINGTVGGSKVALDMYKQYMDNQPMFKNIDFKESTSEILPFSRLMIKERKEIITTDSADEFNICNRGKHIDRDTFHSWLVKGEDMVLLDMRNDYEWDIGHFVNSVRPPMKYFRDLKDSMEFYDQFRDKKIVMFCTGGIRCEPASAYFIAKGFDTKNIYQLEGGIVKYAEKYGDSGYYEGKCFVFDDRMSLPVNTTKDAKILGNCLHCNCQCDIYRNCINSMCNLMFLACDDCMQKYANSCSAECMEITKNGEHMRPLRRSHVKVLHRNK